MNILYLSHLNGASYAGPTYSVPKQIEYQSKIDNVLWYNAEKAGKDEWKNYDYYYDLSEFPNETIKDLPSPFNNPDLIVVELFYNMTLSPLLRELMKSKIPYIVIPRCELTKQAQNRKKIKKKIANIMFMKKFAKKAAAIQYLTKQEYLDSGNEWNKNNIIIPNGIELKEHLDIKSYNNEIKCVSIGRIEPYQKGLDILIEACSKVKAKLKDANCTIDIYGPDEENKVYNLKRDVSNYELESVISFNDAVYGKEKEKILMNSDVFLMTSRFEGHPMALIEALSYGIPALVTKGSNMKNEIEAYDAGWTAENNIESVSIALIKMLKDYKNHYKNNNAINLSNNYSWNKIAEISHKEFMKIIGE